MRERAVGVAESDDGRLSTANLVPGVRVYDEDLFRRGDQEFRSWDPMRSKLAAYLLKGGQQWPFDERTRVLYLGAANGTTPSHVSDIVRHGLVYALEFSPRSFRDLLDVAEPRKNLVPILADAWRPDTYAALVGDVDVVYMDISQRNQGEIFAKNLARFKPKAGILMVKARSVDVTRDPRQVFAETAAKVEELVPYSVVESVALDPYEKDHAALIVRPGKSQRAPPAPQPERPREYRPNPGAPRAQGFAPRPQHGGPRQPFSGGPKRDDRGPRRDDRGPRRERR